MADGLTEEMRRRFIRTTSVMLDIDLTEEAAAIRCPVLVFGAYGDKVMTGEASVEIADITGAEIRMYGEESPHAIYDEAADLRKIAKDFFIEAPLPW